MNYLNFLFPNFFHSQKYRISSSKVLGAGFVEGEVFIRGRRLFVVTVSIYFRKVLQTRKKQVFNLTMIKVRLGTQVHYLSVPEGVPCVRSRE